MNSRGHRRDRRWGDLKLQLLEEWSLLLRHMLQEGWEGGMIRSGRGGRGIGEAGVQCRQGLLGKIQVWTPGKRASWIAGSIRGQK